MAKIRKKERKVENWIEMGR